MEILAPAGNTESLMAAVRSGADAVYLGLKDFSARRNAENFSMDEFRTAAEYCRTRGVKVYVAVNTMIKQSELPRAFDAVVNAYNCGADAFIVSDLGLISALHSRLPQVPLHASTQMTVHSPAALCALKKFGIKRVVLAREMSRGEIKQFCEAAKKENIEVEVFVHGALCMCVSGQCLLSAVLGGRSGNRGLCAGPCRLEFSAAGSGRNDLSLKDLSLIEYLGELEALGVCSAKIEGRMKRPEYVAAATACCRAALEERRDDALDRVVRDVFSRSGFTDGYYQGALGADMFGVRTKDDATASKDTFSYIHSLYRNERQSVGVSFFAEIKRGEKILVTATDNKGASVSVSGAVPESAKRRDTDEAEIKAALSKLGGTPYFAESITVMLDGGLFVSAAALNDIRREAVAGLSKKRGAAAREVAADYSPMQTKKRTPGTPLVYARFCSADAVPDNLSGVNTVILPLDCDFSGLPHNVNKAAELPRYITDEEKTLSRLEALKRAGVTAAYCGNLAAIYLAKRTGLRVICSNGLNCASSESARALSEAGADGVILSAEINIAAAKDFCDEIPIGIFAYGRLPLMLTRNCPVKNAKSCRECGKKSALRDRKGVLFPVTCRCGYSEVLNSTPIYLADKKDDLCVFDFMLLYFSDESKDKAREIIDCYLCYRAPDDGFTRGLYYKNLP